MANPKIKTKQILYVDSWCRAKIWN